MKESFPRLIVVLLLAAAAVMEAQPTYTTNGDGVTVTGWSGSGAVDIPSSVDGIAVTSIGDGAFSFNADITSVTIPDSVTNIGSTAFYECTGLASAIMANSVTTIGEGAFEFCSGLTSVTLSTNLAAIATNTFYNCSSLGAIAIPASVGSIGSEAFGSCTVLSNVTLSFGLANIGSNAFEFCFSLTNITLPASVTSISDYAFANTSLDDVSIPAGVTNLGHYVFVNDSLTAITVDPQNAYYSSLDGVLFNKTQTTLIQYPADATNRSYSIPNSVADIESNAFDLCDNLESLTLPRSLTNIAPFTFYDCSSLVNITIPASVTSIGVYAFSGGAKLASVFFAGDAPGAAGTSFGGDTGATAYYLNDTTGWSAFSTQTGLPVVLWNPVIEASGPLFGLRSNQFGFNITGGTNIPVVVEACANLAHPAWAPLQSLNLTNGLYYFSEPSQKVPTGRFYRISSP